MITWIRTDFTVNVLQEDINACNAGNWWDDPIRRAIMRQFHLNWPTEVRVGWGYLNIMFEEETDQFDVVERKECEAYLQAFARAEVMMRCRFNVRMTKIVRKKPVSDKPAARRYSKTPPKVAKTGM